MVREIKEAALIEGNNETEIVLIHIDDEFSAVLFHSLNVYFVQHIAHCTSIRQHKIA